METLEELAQYYAECDERRVKALRRHDAVTARQEHSMALQHARSAFKAGFSFDEFWYAVENVERARGGVMM